MQSQKEAVFQAIVALFGQTGRTIVEGTKTTLSKEERATVTEMVVQGINAGTVEFSAEARTKHSTTKEVTAYVSGMVGNWLTKDKRLNGGTPYKAKNPGSRAGQGDDIIKNLKVLRSKLTNADDISAVDAEIEKRRLAIASSKTKNVEVNFDAIPAELLSKLNLGQDFSTSTVSE